MQPAESRVDPVNRKPPYPHLGSKAPIVEALIDLRVDLEPGTAFAHLDQARERLGAGLPRSRTLLQGEFQFALGGTVAASSQQVPRGLMFLNDQENRVAQFRLDGFTYSQLAPYDSFANLRSEAEAYWARYLDAVSVERVTRVGLRYINRLNLGMEDLAISLRTRPLLGPAASLVGFELTMPVLRPEADLVGRIRLVADASSDPQVRRSVTLDIDVSTSLPEDTELVVAWERLSALREFKNELFFGSLTESLLKELQG